MEKPTACDKPMAKGTSHLTSGSAERVDDQHVNHVERHGHQHGQPDSRDLGPLVHKPKVPDLKRLINSSAGTVIGR